MLANSVPVVLAGNLDLRFLNGFAPSTSDSFTVVTSSAPITGAFVNVASGARFITADRKFSLLVSYGAGATNPNAVVLSGLQALASDDLPVTINPPGDGTVTKSFLPSSKRVYGKSYTIVATPKTGFVFAGWTGSSTASGASLTFTMASGFHLTANFVPDPFGPVLGTYSGLGTSSSNEGVLTLTMTKAGNFSAKFNVAGVTYRFKGQFNGNGAFDRTFTVAGTPVVVHLTAGFMTAADTVSGTISISGVSYAIGADRDVFTKTNVASMQGTYTIDLPPNADNSNVNAPRPQADGWATATVGATGNVTIAGTLADGTKFSAAGIVSKTGVFPVYAALYQKLGAIVGTLTFASPPRSGVSDVTGTISWAKPVQPATSIFPHAFTTDLTAAGSFYSAPPASVQAQLGLPVDGHGTLALVGGNLSPNLTEAIVISSANKVTTPLPGALPDNLKVTFNVKAGTFTGTFLHNTTEKLTAFSGVLLPKQQIGRGFFLGSTDSGKVQLGP